MHSPAEAMGHPQPAPDSTLRGRPAWYVAGVVAAGALATVLALAFGPAGDLRSIAFWGLFAAASQILIFPTVTRRGEITIGTCVHLSMMMVLGPRDFLPALWLSRLLVNGLVQHKAWYRAMFNAAQVTLSVLLAWLAYHALGAPTAPAFPLLREAAPGFLAGTLVYYAVNMALVSGILGLTSGTSIWDAWRANYGYAAEIVSTLGLVLLTPVAVVSTVALGGLGMALFLLPMLFIRDASARYVELRRTQQALIGAERLAAKGEIAAEVGHEITNHLTVVQAQLDLLRANQDRLSPEETARRLASATEHLDRIGVLAHGMIDFSRRSSEARPTRIDELFTNTLAFLRLQPRFDGVEVQVELDPSVHEVRVDPEQIQQLLMNLTMNAVNAMAEAASTKREIHVWLKRIDLAEVLEIGIADTGPGVPQPLRARIFEPGFTTRPEGHGFGLSTAYNVVQNHGGSIRVGTGTKGGAQFLIALPYRPLGLTRRFAGSPTAARPAHLSIGPAGPVAEVRAA
jgi:signal transduction histidine kinase